MSRVRWTARGEWVMAWLGVIALILLLWIASAIASHFGAAAG